MAKCEDLREWINQSEEIGELMVIKGANTKYEIGAINELTSKNRGPAVLHEEIQGFPPNFRLLTNLLSNIRTFNLAFGLPVENTIRDTIRTLQRKVPEWETAARDFPPRVVETGPILENVVEGDNMDLTKFPAPIWHELDGGPYIGTAHGVVTRDPDTGHINVGAYRCQLFDRQTIGMNAVPGKHGSIHRDKYFQRGEACPVVAVLGVHPLFFAISASHIPVDICELNYLGGMQGQSVSIIEGKATGLPIPVNAEIAVEGFIEQQTTRKEGPFGEFTGYYGSGDIQPSIRVVTLYHRNDPILTGSSPAKGIYCDEAFFRSVWQSALLYNQIVGANVPGVKGVWWTPHMEVVSIEQLYNGHATQAGHVTAQAGAGALSATHRYTIVVDDDIDPFDLDDVMWAVHTRSSPASSDIIKESWSSRADPLISRPADVFATSRTIIYAVKPFAWRHEFPPVSVASEKLRREVFTKWKDRFKDRWQSI